MLFKRIDRYVSLSFLALFGGCLLVVGGIYVSFDVLKRLEDLEQVGLLSGLGMLVGYYARLLPLFLMETAPGLVLVAAGMVLVRMGKTRELLALKATGTSVHRIVAPIFLLSLAISVVVAAGRESVGPRFFRESEMIGRKLDGAVERGILLSDPAFGRTIYVNQYDVADGVLKDVSLIELYPEGTLKEILQADKATWDTAAHALNLENVWVRRFEPSGVPSAPPAAVPSMAAQTGLTDADLLRAAEKNSQFGMVFETLSSLRGEMRQNPGVPYYRVSFHSRLASFFGPLILLLVGIPFLIGFESAVDSRFLGAIVCILLAGGLFALTFVFSSMGNTGTINPVLAAWLPSVSMSALGLWLFESMLT